MYQFLILSDIWAELTWNSVLSVRSGFPNGTNGIPISFKVLPMVPLVIPFVPMGMPMVPLALPMVQLVTLAYGTIGKITNGTFGRTPNGA